MICDICKLNEAKVSVEQVTDVVTKHIYLCLSCSRRLGFGMFSENIDISITKLLENSDTSMSEDKKYAQCPVCGQSLSDIKSKQKIGCAECFSFFRAEILEILGQKKKNLRYLGLLQGSSDNSFKEKNCCEELRQKLKEAVEIEDYETAAALRDELKALEKKNDLKV
ncbi:UvrB/UvrC motif-containing protein [Treponema putidum]|uniref:UVR domain-containing protein n=1 Tax=Treponema putidum TaxID=221027 RepID=A0AAE9MV85_9SPIR|nr:UvrB/UvrC motif-containing protein [Treponema putidum]UTY33698.1 hypothetical protein E4N74_06520 [Treponema putidum]